MTLGAPGNEHYRFRAGMLFLAVGVALILFAWLSWFFRSSSSDGAPIPPPIQNSAPVRSSSMLSPVSGDETDDAGANRRSAFVRAAPMVLLTTFLVVVVFLGGSLVLVRGLRRYLAEADRKRPVPTPTDDVWAMHRVPDEDET